MSLLFNPWSTILFHAKHESPAYGATALWRSPERSGTSLILTLKDSRLRPSASVEPIPGLYARRVRSALWVFMPCGYTIHKVNGVHRWTIPVSY